MAPHTCTDAPWSWRACTTCRLTALRAAGENEVVRLQWAAIDAGVPITVPEDATEPTVALVYPNYPRTKEVQ